MTISTAITDGTGVNGLAKVTKQQQLVTGNLDFSDSVFKLIGTDDEVVNFIEPKAGHFAIITDIILYGNKNVNPVTDSTVIIYEAGSPTEAYTDQNVVFQQQVTKQQSIILTGLNWKVTEGKFLNATADDDDVFINIASYFAPVN